MTLEREPPVGAEQGQDSPRSQDARYLAHRQRVVGDVLQHLVEQHAVERVVVERQPVAIRDDETYVVGVVELFARSTSRAFTSMPTTDCAPRSASPST